MNATATRERPSYLRLVRPEEMDEPEPSFRVDVERGPDGEEVLIATISRDPRLLAELRARMGDGLTLRKATPQELTFVLRQSA